MKPPDPTSPNKGRLPLTDQCFHARFGEWRSYYDGDDSDSRRFHNFSREFLLESARERAKEMAVFALVVIASAWPVIYMVVVVVKLLWKGQPDP